MSKKDYQTLLHDVTDQDGISIHAHSCATPFLLILLRHMGCAFCRRTLSEMQQSLGMIRDCGYCLGVVHMNTEAEAVEQLRTYGLDEQPRFRDPERILYQGLGLHRMHLRSVFRPDTLREGVKASIRYRGSWPTTDARQLPGAFLIDQGSVVAGERVMNPEDHPDFLSLLIYSEALKSNGRGSAA